ncbi:MAG: hypothetical protein HY040_10560 [Planctomycetes bacterium]|nr:hypothetical protein [Planctomycetota bacterium]
MHLEPPVIIRPFRASLLLFAGLAAFFTVCTVCGASPPNVEPILFLTAGAVYCLILSFVGIGIALAWRRRVLTWLVLVFAIQGIGWFGYVLVLRFDPHSFMRLLPQILFSMSVFWGASLVLLLIAVGSGWAEYFRWRRSKSR